MNKEPSNPTSIAVRTIAADAWPLAGGDTNGLAIVPSPYLSSH